LEQSIELRELLSTGHVGHRRYGKCHRHATLSPPPAMPISEPVIWVCRSHVDVVMPWAYRLGMAAPPRSQRLRSLMTYPRGTPEAAQGWRHAWQTSEGW